MSSPATSRAPSSASMVATSIPDKVVVRLKAIGNAPILKQSVFKISTGSRFDKVILFLRKELGYRSHDSLFVYVNSAFAPAPDEVIGNLVRACAVDGSLIVNYSTTPAWG
ncbi:ubiquitin-like autophagy protein Apg12-domain-containing protein [Entophlyctis helioformis]|nr:ubiquitin-like autophagy protein Apg12-domain-containing protein [Entophlyctis helioformis]